MQLDPEAEFYRDQPPSPQLRRIEAMEEVCRIYSSRCGLRTAGSDDGWVYDQQNLSQVKKKDRVIFVLGPDQQPPDEAPLPHTFRPARVPKEQKAGDEEHWHGASWEGPNFSFPDADQPLRLRRPHQPYEAQAELQFERAAFRGVKFQMRYASTEGRELYRRRGEQRQQSELRRIKRTIKKRAQGQKPPCRRGLDLGQKAKKKEKLRLRLALQNKTFDKR